MKLNRLIYMILAEDENIIAMAYKDGLGYAGFNVTLAKDERFLRTLK